MNAPQGRAPALAIAGALGVAMEERPEDGPGIIAGEATAPASILDHDGNFRLGALLGCADTVAGLAAGLAALPDRWCVTTNLHLRVVRTRGRLPIRFRSSLWRVGRAAVVTGADITDADGSLVATAMLANTALVPEHGPPIAERPWRVRVEPRISMDDQLQLAVDANRVTLQLRDELRNPWGILHGGVIGYLVEAAARTTGAGAPGDTVLHFLRPGRVGPVTATATVLGDRPDATITRVEVRDEGADRIMAIATTAVRHSALL